MYQGTISGAFKNALDWLHALGAREPAFLHDEVIGLISAAGGTHGLQAINTMEFATRALRGWAVPYVVPVPVAARVFDRDGEVQDAAIELQLRSLGAEVVRVAERFAADPALHRASECDEAAERVSVAT
jgi:FMN reductase